MKRMGINQKTVQLFDEVFIKGNLQDQIHLFGDYGLFFTYRNVPHFPQNKIVNTMYIHIRKHPQVKYSVGMNGLVSFDSFMDNFKSPLDYMNRHDKSFRESFITYANKLVLESKLNEKPISTGKRSKI